MERIQNKEQPMTLGIGLGHTDFQKYQDDVKAEQTKKHEVNKQH